jgi:agmatinase
MKANLAVRYRVHPKLHCEAVGEGRIEISLPFGSKRLRAAESIATLLDQIRAQQPVTGEALAITLGNVVFEALAKYLFLLPESETDSLLGGICVPAARPAGCALPLHDLDILRDNDLVVFHVPITTTSESDVSVASGGRWVRSHLAQSIESPLAIKGGAGMLLDLDFGSSLDVAALRLFDVGDVVYQPLDDRVSDIGERAAYQMNVNVAQRRLDVSLIPSPSCSELCEAASRCPFVDREFGNTCDQVPRAFR